MELAFPSSNVWGIPDLDPALQPDAVPLPVWAWGSVARDRDHGGTWHFYVDDKRFAMVLRDPSRVIDTGCAACCEPNVSAFDSTPLAEVLAGILRKRTAAAVWQRAGVGVFVDVNMPARVLDRNEWRLGVPDGWRAFSTRGYDRRPESLDDEYHAAERVAGGLPLLLVVGGGRKVAEWCRERPGVVHSGYQVSRNAYSAAGNGVAEQSAHESQGSNDTLHPAPATLGGEQ